MKDPVKILAELIAIPSPSSVSNRPVAKYVADFLRPLGWRIKKFSYRDGQGIPKVNLIAILGDGSDLKAELALCAHADTVPWDAAWTKATALTERSGKLYGRGTCDMKGFIAAVLAVAQRLRDATLKRPLAFVLTADEEIGCLGAKRLAAAGTFRPRYALVGEPTSLRPARAGKGYGLAEVIVRGQEAHSAFPAQGSSAFYPAARLISRIEAIGSALAKKNHPAFEPPHTTLNIGIITGGRAKNITPGECRFLLEWRPVGGSQEVVVPASQAAASVRKDYPKTKISLTVSRSDPGFETPAQSSLVGLLVELTGTKPGSIAFNSEAPQFRKMGAEVVVFGPGDMRVAHRTGEFVSKKEFLRSIDLLQKVIERLCQA